MTLKRVPGTDKALLLDVLDSLPDLLVQQATAKEKSTLYAVSRPNNKLGLHLPVAAGLDAALFVQGYGGVFLPWAESRRDAIIAELGGPRLHDPMDPLHRMTELVSSIGNVADEIRAAVDAKGVAGSDIVRHEADRARAAIDETRRALDLLEKDIDAHTKSEPSGAPHKLQAVG